MSTRRSGLAASELALVLPVLVLLLLGGIDLGRFASFHLTVTSATQAGAQFASSEPCVDANEAAWRAAIRQAVEDELSEMDGFDPANLEVTISRQAESADCVTIIVTVSYPFHPLIPYPGLPRRMELSQLVAVRLIRP